METKQKTLAECKDEAAKIAGFDSWKDYEKSMDISAAKMNEMWQSAIDIQYASEENRKKDEPKQSDVEEAAVNFCDNYDFDSCLTGTGVKTGKAVYDGFIAGAKWQSQQPLSIAWLSEKEIRTACKLNEEIAGAFGAQSELRKRVNAVDQVKLKTDLVNLFMNKHENAKWNNFGDKADAIIKLILKTK